VALGRVYPHVFQFSCAFPFHPRTILAFIVKAAVKKGTFIACFLMLHEKLYTNTKLADIF
jgi:hypothetical protein